MFYRVTCPWLYFSRSWEMDNKEKVGETLTFRYGLDLRTFIALIVVLVWAILALSTLFTKSYAAFGAATPVAMIVVGFLFGQSRQINGNYQVKEKPNNEISRDLSDW